MNDHKYEEDSEDGDLISDVEIEDEEILRRYARFKLLQKALAVIAVVLFIGVFVGFDLARYVPFLVSGSRSPDYLTLLDDFASFDPGTVEYTVTYDVSFNEEVLDGALRAAAADWQSTLDGLIDFRRVEDEENADLVFVVVDDIPNPGRAHMEYAQGVYRPRVELNASELGDPMVLRLVIAHEMGHVLGIWGHSDDPGDLMYHSPVRVRPSRRDRRTMELVYGRF